MFKPIWQFIKGEPLPPDSRHTIRNLIEFGVLLGTWGLMLLLIFFSGIQAAWLIALLLVWASAKTFFFGIENIQQLLSASHHNTPFYKFMMILLVNMAQIVLSFALDYHCLHQINGNSFKGINPELAGSTLVFEYFYYSVLSFTFFGYGDITPQTIPAKILTMTEVLVAFITVIFLLSDFISLKESVSRPRKQ